jgi:DNA-binding GntR family transcriptional regulator
MGQVRQRVLPVERRSTVDLIAGELRRAIVDGVLPPGSPLGEVELAEQLGVSRGPLREAAQRLVAEGLLTSARRRGLAVAEIGAAEVPDLYLARTAVEGGAVRRVLRSGDVPAAVAALTAAARRIEALSGEDDAWALGNADLDFHRVLVAQAGSPRLTAAAESLLAQTRLCTLSLGETYHVRADLAAAHTAILDALRAGDEHAALAAVDAHMTAAVERLTGTGAAAGAPVLEGPAASDGPPLARLEAAGVED